MKKRILVTGSTGFIGQNLVDYLQSIGHYELIKTTRCITAEDSKLTLDLSDLSTIENTELSNIDIVIHLAGAAHNRVNNSEEVEIINTKSTAMLANKSVLNNVSRFIFVSTIGVHGSNTRMIVNEDSTINCQTTYSISKYNAEKAIIDVTQESSTTYTILRPVLVIGKDAPGNIGKLNKLIRTRLPLPFKNIKNSRSLIHVNDLVEVLRLVIEEPLTENKTYVVGSKTSVSTTELIKYLSQTRNKLFFFPKFIFYFLFFCMGKKTIYHQLFNSYEVDSTNLYNDINWSVNSPLKDRQESKIKSALR